jgi:hypothetical protein
MGLNDFAVFILTNNRPDRVYTYDSLRRCGYTGKIYLVIDDLDKSRDKYIEKYGDQVLIFDKVEASKKFDQADNFNDMRAIIYARNACFDIAEKIGLKYFCQLDDDYMKFDKRFNKNLDYEANVLRNLDHVFACILKFYKSATKIKSIAISQGGDWIGGQENPWAEKLMLRRKCMNSFFCTTDRRFKFVGRINEDVNTYTSKASTGDLFFTVNQVSLTQKQTQTNSGGMTELYLDSGTYIKSFYTVIFQPSSVKVKILQSKNKRLHHSISWKHTVPLILSEKLKKK